MCDIPDNFDSDVHQIVEAVSGKSFRFPKELRLGATFFIDIEENVILGVNKSSSNLDIFVLDNMGVFQRAGNIAFQPNENGSSICVTGSGIKDIRYGSDDRYNKTNPTKAFYMDLNVNPDPIR
ncbi:hypothetical protein D3C76_51540 [compost metagenome]